MKNSMIGMAFTLLLLTTSTALADEVWNSTFGQVVYANESGPTATWTYSHNARPGVIYILGLGGMYSERGTYNGYWAQNKSDRRCKKPRLGLNNQKTYYWGKFHIVFLDSNYPSRWKAKWGYCNDNPASSWDGQPI